MKNKGITEMFRLLWNCDWSGLLYAPTNNGWLQLFGYGFVGGGAFVVDFGVYCILGWLGMQYLLAGIISFIAGFAFNFLVSRWMIFRSTASSKIDVRELISVLAISVIGLLLTEALLFAGTDLIGLDYRIAKIAASILVLFWNYAARKIFVYK